VNVEATLIKAKLLAYYKLQHVIDAWWW